MIEPFCLSSPGKHGQGTNVYLSLQTPYDSDHALEYPPIFQTHKVCMINKYEGSSTALNPLMDPADMVFSWSGVLVPLSLSCPSP